MFRPGLNVILVPNDEEVTRILVTLAENLDGGVVSLITSHYLSLKLSHTLGKNKKDFYIIRVGNKPLRASIIFSNYLSREYIRYGLVGNVPFYYKTLAQSKWMYRELSFIAALIRWSSLEVGKPCIWVITVEDEGLLLKRMKLIFDQVVYAL